jgi:hypothetical protein
MKKLILPLLAISLLTGCKKKEDDVVEDPKEEALKYDVPTTYNFSNAAYPGQTDRLNMLGALKSEVSKSHTGATVAKQTLLDMYNNPTKDGAAFTEAGVGATGKNLSGKTEDLAKTAMTALLEEIAANSGSMDTASNGNSGLVAYKTGHILVNAKGQEYAQLVEKGLMGSCFYYQISSKYLSDTKIGKDEDKAEELDKQEDGKNYTNREHHFDEAFGYFGVPADWDKVQGNSDNDKVRFWGKYCQKRDAVLKTNAIFDNFIKGRAAIGADGGYHVDQEAEVTKIKETLEQIAAATAINYFKSSASQADLGKKLHGLTEGLCFLRATQYGGPKVTKADVDAVEVLLNNGNFFTITPTQINAAVDKLSSVAGLDAFKAQL